MKKTFSAILCISIIFTAIIPLFANAADISDDSDARSINRMAVGLDP